MAEAKPLTAQHTECEKGELENTARRRAPAPHSDRAQAGNAAHRDLLTTQAKKNELNGVELFGRKERRWPSERHGRQYEE